MCARYILGPDGRTPVKEPDLYKWVRQAEAAKWSVQQTTLGKIKVSTVFLGIDHSFGDGPPLLFETMIFGGKYEEDEYQERYSTWAQAEAGHEVACTLVRGFPSLTGG
jgi:hypothetical protein